MTRRGMTRAAVLVLAGAAAVGSGGCNKKTKDETDTRQPADQGVTSADPQKVARAKAELAALRLSLNEFEVDNGRFPTSEEGLNALVVKPADLDTWKHKYVDRINRDPWGQEYIYRVPSTQGAEFDLLSGGPDTREGGGDDVVSK